MNYFIEYGICCFLKGVWEKKLILIYFKINLLFVNFYLFRLEHRGLLY